MQGGLGALAWRTGRHQVLAGDSESTEESRCGRHSHCDGRRIERISSMPEGGVSKHHGPDLYSASLRYSLSCASYKERRELSLSLKKIYQVPAAESAESALDAFESSELGGRYPDVVQSWCRN